MSSKKYYGTFNPEWSTSVYDTTVIMESEDVETSMEEATLENEDGDVISTTLFGKKSELDFKMTIKGTGYPDEAIVGEPFTLDAKVYIVKSLGKNAAKKEYTSLAGKCVRYPELDVNVT